VTPLEWVVAAAAYAALEYWLGKTDRVRPGSVVEAALQGLKFVAGVLVTRKK
jgi:hypothetical protein